MSRLTSASHRGPAAHEPAPGDGWRVLFVSYPFPPVGGAGVQRTTKFAKYLPEHGWQVSVLTVANPSVPALDTSLLADVPEQTVVRRARTLEPGYAFKAVVSAGGGGPAPWSGPVRRLSRGLLRRLTALLLQPDPQVLWFPGAVRAGLRLLRELPHDAIVATGPPFSSFLIGAALSRRTGLPLVLDYRDEWDLSSAYWENKRLGPFSRFLQARMQGAVVRAADALVATTPSSARALEAVRARAGGRGEVAWIYNGYDPDDFRAPTAATPDKETYRLAYVGTLWELTSVAPLVDGVRELTRRAPALAARLELVFAGRRTGRQEQALAGLQGLPCRLVRHPYLDHSQAVELIRSADCLCALLSDLPGAGRVVPAKVFEYVAARRPVLAIAPRGDLWDLLGSYPLAVRHLPGDTAGIAESLAKALASPGAAANLGGWDGGSFDRRSQAGQLAALLGSLRAGRAL